ncbi:MAG: hypothetical protein Q9193_004442 [Seirophora villosa]
MILPANVPEFHQSQRRVGQARESNCHPCPNVAPRIANLQCYRTVPPHPVHPDDRPRPPDQVRGQRSKSDRKPLPILPRRPVERYPAKHVEEQMLRHNDRKPRRDVDTDERQHVLEDVVNVIAPHHRADDLQDHDEEAPQPARHRFAVSPQNLQAQGGRVCPGRIVGDAPKRQDDDTEAAEATEAVVAGQQQCTRRNVISFAPRRSRGNARRDPDGDDVDEHHREPLTHPCRHERETLAGRLGKVDGEISACSRKADDDRVLQSEEGTPVGGNCARGTRRFQGGIEMRASGANQDTESDKLRYPRISGPS